MLKRIRRLQISLAAKCQLLFGAAVVLIISAALFVPWQRMEQLMDQFNEKSASTLADRAEMDHVAQHASAAGTFHPLPIAADKPSSRPTNPPLEGANAEEEEGPEQEPYQMSRIVGAALVRSQDRHLTTRFERSAFSDFIKDPDTSFDSVLYGRKDGTDGYRYARPLFLKQSCMSCHAQIPLVVAAKTPRRSATGPTTAAVASVGGLVGIVSIDMPSQIDASQILLNRVFILTAGMLAGTLAIIVFYLITTRLILQPVRVLQETAEKVSVGDLNIRSDISTGDEFQQLSETFNTMLTNLKAGEDQLRAVNKSLDLKLGQLAESNVALYESNRLKNEFLANVSHELRTPLNSILGFADLLQDSLQAGVEGKGLDGRGADAKANRYIQNILSSGRNLLALISDLLDLAKIEAGRMEVRPEPLSLNDLFEGLASILKPLTEAKGLWIDLAVAADVPIIQTDPSKLQQILYNFLSNAIKYSPAGGRIDLWARLREPEQVIIAVVDRGPGIDPAKQGLIFEKFRQLDGSVTREHSGTGLGLAISRDLALLMNGEIGVRSTPGQGATFWIMLPLKIESGARTVRERPETAMR